MMSSKFCWVLLVCCGSLLAEKHSIYTRENISDTAINSIADFTTSAPTIASGASVTQVLNSFQSTFDMDPSAFAVKFEILRRTSRHVIFCLYKKEWATNPKTNSVVTRSGQVTQVECEALPLKHVLDGSSVYVLDKPAGN